MAVAETDFFSVALSMFTRLQVADSGLVVTAWGILVMELLMLLFTVFAAAATAVAANT